MRRPLVFNVSIVGFQNFADNMGLFDLGFYGPYFSLSNNRFGVSYLYLFGSDLANRSWLSCVNDAMVFYLSHVIYITILSCY